MASGAGVVKTSDVDARRCLSLTVEEEDEADLFLENREVMVGDLPRGEGEEELMLLASVYIYLRVPPQKAAEHY